MSKTPSIQSLRTVEQLQEIPNHLSGQSPDFLPQEIVEVDLPLNTLSHTRLDTQETAVSKNAEGNLEDFINFVWI